MLVRPKITSPARFSRFTCSLSAVAGGVSAKNVEPRVIATPAIGDVRSFMRNGTPRNGPSGRPSAIALLAVIVELHDHGVHRRVARLDTLDRGFEEVAGRDLVAPHQIGEPECVVLLRSRRIRSSRCPPGRRLCQQPMPLSAPAMRDTVGPSRSNPQPPTAKAIAPCRSPFESSTSAPRSPRPSTPLRWSSRAAPSG